MTNLNALNSRCAIPAELTFKEGPGGLTVADISNPHGRASIALQGAQVLSWAPHGEAAVVWLSKAARFAPGTSLRGGIPVCWPWFGPHPTELSFPNHGFARTAPWAPVETKRLDDGATYLRFRLIRSEATDAFWPHPARLEMEITVGRALELRLTTRNSGPAPVTIGDALHAYLEVSDVRKIAIQGLDGRPYIDKADGGRRKRQSGPVTINAETDRIYLDSAAECVVEDPGYRRCIRIAKGGSRSTVVWNPWADKASRPGDFEPEGYLGMVCVESANAADDMVTIPPSTEHHLWARYQVEPRR
jgi:glucose-6-phosphate 1-epimerase